jgi:nanoRNase/pAp phosphatase (c-di-AMP/oligoRNAs hydrolase)
MPAKTMIKKKINTIHERNKITAGIIKAIIKRKSFLICGHENPDEDCVSSMIAFAILLTKFDKVVQVYIDGRVNDNLNYLLNICKYNSIKVLNSKSNIKRNVDTIVICDTAKRSMLDVNKRIQNLLNKKEIIKIEIDHHIGGDSEYIGDKRYSLVDEASSASELVGFIALKLRNMKSTLMHYFIFDPFSRNFILAVLTGIVGDTNMGQFLKSRREKVYYKIFSKMYNEMLMKLTVRETNLNKIEDVSNALHSLTMQEDECYHYIISKKMFTNSTGYIILKLNEMEYIKRHFDFDVFITVVKSVADELAEESGKISLFVYFDDHYGDQLYQFRMRRSHNFKKFDLRKVLDQFNISNGGGHEGAIGFRFTAGTIKNIDEYVNTILSDIELKIGKL